MKIIVEYPKHFEDDFFQGIKEAGGEYYVYTTGRLSYSVNVVSPFEGSWRCQKITYNPIIGETERRDCYEKCGHVKKVIKEISD